MTSSDSSLSPNLGVSATVFFDSETEGPHALEPDLGLTSAEEYFEYGDNLPNGCIGNIDIVSIYTLHVALYALQNPTPENIKRALYKIGTSGDCEEHTDFETLMPLPVPEPHGWNDYVPEGI